MFLFVGGILMKRFLLGTVVSVVAGGSAFAQCVPDGAVANSVVTCATDDPNGFSNNANGLDITVNSGVTVSSAAGDVFRIRGSDVKLTNNGTIDSNSDNDAIDGRAGLTVTNNGTMTSDGRGINTRGFSGATVTNTGSIVTRDKALRMDEDGPNGGNNNTVTNSGLIQSTAAEAIEGLDFNTVTNAATGRIIGFDDALNLGRFATIKNYGLIQSTGTDTEPQDAIDLDSGNIVNYATGTIESLLGAAIDYDPSADSSLITNYGRITGQVGIDTDGADTGLQKIENRGTLEGLAGTALNLGSGDDMFVAFEGSTIKGSGYFGDGKDMLTIFGTPTGTFGGPGAIFDGGAGTEDQVDFFDLALDILDVRYTPETDLFSFRFDHAGGQMVVNLVNWESFMFDGTTRLSRDEIRAIATVPLPAGGVLLLAALGMLGLTAARRRRAA
jgi:hypothetical protein